VVSLADPLTKYVPDFIAPLSEGGRPIRLIDLATHSAGLPREVPHEPGPPDNPFVHITREAFVAWLKSNPLLFTPGTAVSYSNFGFDLLAAALSAAAKNPIPTSSPSASSHRSLSQIRPSRRLTARRRASCADTILMGPPCPPRRRAKSSSAPAGFIPAHAISCAGCNGISTGCQMRVRSSASSTTPPYLWRDGLNTVFGMDESGHMDAMGLGWVIMAPKGDRPLILQKAGGLQGTFSYVAFAPARNIAVIVAINAFEISAGLAMAKAANDLIAELATR
jgi:D-alanyl-D-alanine-carboxypeptidase/D-alanyl-D-alanine-endopeptidase